ncbi:MAG: hypothetical protein IT436_15900 [Phycisphaerales bacterium]|nr:hypothetical protein [Phycisphaerales bacterium]
MAPVEIWQEQPGWVNPVPRAKAQAYLGEIVFPANCSSSSSDARLESDRLLRLFYCDERERAGRDLPTLEAYIRAPAESLLVLEGDVGVGKTWFVRYNLVTAPRFKTEHRFGVIDLLHMAPGRVRVSLYNNLSPILDSYFQHVHHSAKDALYQYALRRLAPKYGGSLRNVSAELQVNARTEAQKWLVADAESYAETMLDALEELPGPLLFLVLDNLDRMSPDDQEELLNIAMRVLRNHRIRLIVPLRRTSRLLRDRHKGLHEVRYHSMTLSPLDPSKMTRARFYVTHEGESLVGNRCIQDGTKCYSYPDLHKLLFNSEAGELVRSLVGHNARVALMCVRRLIHSDLLRGIHNLGNPQFLIASLMLSTDYMPDDGALILNLFDNEERVAGEALIRFRVLERLYLNAVMHLDERGTVEYFESRGYRMDRVKGVVTRFLMAHMVCLDNHWMPEEVREISVDRLEEVGAIRITPVGSIYVTMLLTKMWYFVAAKRGMVDSVPDAFKSFDLDGKYHYMSHNDLVRYLQSEEQAERHRRVRWESQHGRLAQSKTLAAPHRYAEIALSKEKSR